MNKTKINKTLLVSIDGLRSDALDKAKTPVLDMLIHNGSSCMSVKTVTPSITLPAHFSIFTSLAPYSHGVLTNNALPNMSVAGQSLFYHVKNHDGKVSSFYSWDHLRNLAMPGVMDYSFFKKVETEKDLIILAAAASAHIITQAPDFTFVYFEWTDIIGHRHGWMSPEYLKAIETTDHALGLIVSGINPLFREKGFNIVVVSDHGGKEKHHIDNTPEITNVPFIACGEKIRKNFRIEDDMRLLDLAPTIAGIMDIPFHFAWQGKKISSIFMDSIGQPALTRVA